MSMLSATPVAIFAMVEAVAGATTIASAQRPKSTWLFQEPSRELKNSVITGLRVKVLSVTGVINSLPAGVITTWTSWPALTNKRMSEQAL